MGRLVCVPYRKGTVGCDSLRKIFHVQRQSTSESVGGCQTCDISKAVGCLQIGTGRFVSACRVSLPSCLSVPDSPAGESPAPADGQQCLTTLKADDGR